MNSPRNTLTRTLAIVLSTVALTIVSAAANQAQVAGPLVGTTTASTADLWFFAPKDAHCEVEALPAEGEAPKSTAELKPIENLAGKAEGTPRRARLSGLKADTAYRYTVTVDGKQHENHQGTFRTQPAPGTPHKLRMVLTSCMKFGQPQDSWNILLAEKPHLHLTVGDTHYADTTNPTEQWGHHLRYRRVPQFAQVIRNVPTYSMWDDHDYGPNDSDGTAKGKENSLAGWQQFWANPGAGTKQTPGAFYRFSWGEVDFFVVDGRYHRSPDAHPDNNAKRMLGDAQFRWLLAGLKASKAKFKVIASGSTLFHSSRDGWRIYTFSRHRLLDAIKANKIPGVVYMSGDIHKSLVREHHESKRVGYPFVEVISSGIANSHDLSFACVDFDTTAQDPTMRVRIIMGDKSIKMDKSWKLSELSHKE